MTEPLFAFSTGSVMQWPAVMQRSVPTSVTEHVDRFAPSTCRIMPTLRATVARTSFAGAMQRAFSQLGGTFGGVVQNQNGSYLGSTYGSSSRNGSQFDSADGSCLPACRSPRPYLSSTTLPLAAPFVM